MTASQPTHNAQCSMLFVLLLALVLRLLLWSQPLHQLANDEVEYVTVASDLLAGRGWQFYTHYHWLRAPLYPLFLAGSLWLTGGDLHWAALPNIALSVATVYLNYRLALTLSGRRTAGVAALLTALLWTLATFASLYMAETLFTFLFTAALVCLTGATNDQRLTTNDEGQAKPSFLVHRWLLAGAGVLFGLATLTRSITLLFLPIVAVWLLLRTENYRASTQPQRQERTKLGGTPNSMITRSSALGCLSFVLCSLLVIAPWTIRNYLAYGRLIAVETGLAYNLWAFNEPHEDQDSIFRTLEGIPNPAERSDYATAKGLARLREDPAILLRKLWPNWIYLWRVKPIEDRFIQENYYADVDLPLFGAALLFDDALYLLIALAGVAGLVLYRPTTDDQRPATTKYHASRITHHASRFTSYISRNPKWLMIAWLLYVVATVLLTHGEARYRHFLFPVLIPCAAWVLTRRFETQAGTEDGGRRIEGSENSVQPSSSAIFKHKRHLVALSSCHLVIAVLWALIGGTALAFYPWAWAGQNLARGWHALLAEIARAAGSYDIARHESERALAAHETADGWLLLGDVERAAGDTRRALAAYRAATRLIPAYIPAVARVGDLLRATGDQQAARDTFAGAYVDQQRLADWSWRATPPDPATRLDIGNGLDFGFVGGVYPAEEQQGATARWTAGRGMLRLANNGSRGNVLVQLRLAAPRPPGAPAQVQICAAGRCWPLAIGPRWRTYVLSYDTTSAEPLLLEIRSDTFEAPDGRRLGVLIDSAALTAVAQR